MLMPALILKSSGYAVSKKEINSIFASTKEMEMQIGMSISAKSFIMK